MASNEKNGVVRARFRAYALSFAGAAVIGAVGLGLVHQHNLHHELAKRSGRLDQEIRVLTDRIQQQLRIEAGLRSPSALEARIRELDLGLEPIRSDQRIFLQRSARLLPLVRLQGIIASNVPSTLEVTSAVPATPFRGTPGPLPTSNPGFSPSSSPGDGNPEQVASRGRVPPATVAHRKVLTPVRVAPKTTLATTR